MKPIISVAIFSVFFTACQKGGGDGGDAQLGVAFHYVDSSDNNLFNVFNDGQHGYWMDGVMAYDFKNGNNIVLSGYPNDCSGQVVLDCISVQT